MNELVFLPCQMALRAANVHHRAILQATLRAVVYCLIPGAPRDCIWR